MVDASNTVIAASRNRVEETLDATAHTQKMLQYIRTMPNVRSHPPGSWLSAPQQSIGFPCVRTLTQTQTTRAS
jgi:hypothetical protein